MFANARLCRVFLLTSLKKGILQYPKTNILINTQEIIPKMVVETLEKTRTRSLKAYIWRCPFNPSIILLAMFPSVFFLTATMGMYWHKSGGGWFESIPLRLGSNLRQDHLYFMKESRAECESIYRRFHRRGDWWARLWIEWLDSHEDLQSRPWQCWLPCHGLDGTRQQQFAAVDQEFLEQILEVFHLHIVSIKMLMFDVEWYLSVFINV